MRVRRCLMSCGLVMCLCRVSWRRTTLFPIRRWKNPCRRTAGATSWPSGRAGSTRASASFACRDRSDRAGSHVVGRRRSPKIRAWPAALSLNPGRYRVTAYLRGLDIGAGVWNQTTEFMFAGNYMPLKKNGTFGWTRLTFVGEIRAKGDVHPILA